MEETFFNEISEFRKYLHRFPEISGNEEKTARAIKEKLMKCQPKRVIEHLGGHGLAFVFGDSGEVPNILFRCELDALPIREINTFEHKSSNNEVSHKCGHDGHMSILTALAFELQNMDLSGVQVILLFQPSEENGAGAKAVLEDEKFADIKPDYVVALHNIPGKEKSSIHCRVGNFTPAVISMIIELEGKTSHAGEMEFGINPALAIAEFVNKAAELNHAEKDENWAVLTPIQIDMGKEAYGISAGHGVVRYTIRCWSNSGMKALSGKLEELVNEISTKHKLKSNISWTQYFASNENNEMVVELIRKAAQNTGLKYDNMNTPFQWGEDFGLFTDRFKGAMFGLGSGLKQPALHNPDYDYPDEITPAGLAVFKEIIEQIKHKK